jgi:hypothetical protein
MDWFQTKKENLRAWDQIKEYIKNDLYSLGNGIKTALADWAPLPREGMGEWPEEYAPIAPPTKKNPENNNPYLMAFHDPKYRHHQEENVKSQFSDFHKDVEIRAGILKALFQMSRAKVIIGIGGAGGYKKDALELMFSESIFRPLGFAETDMTTKSGGKLNAYNAVIQSEKRDINIFLVPFPLAGNVFKTKKDALCMLKELVCDYIKPII